MQAGHGSGAGAWVCCNGRRGNLVSGMLVYPASNSVTFRARLRLQFKAQFAVNGRALDKSCNAEMQSQARSRRASRKALIRCVMALANEMTITCEPCLAAKRFLTR